ncbi:MAG: mannose-1-phosphate guanylyltransferase [Bacillota bacterium]|nr:mannose-1-phosphate guanylyltransferase [Bacillota bacterium]
MTSYAVIMAGGKGERFWPWSRSSLPKQFLALTGERTLIQQAFDRLSKSFSPQHILVVTGEDFLQMAREQLPQLPRNNFLVEPVGRNTAPCIGLAALVLAKKDPEASMMVFPADHLVKKEEVFQACLERCLDLAAGGKQLVTIGIIPTRPETGYGYIEREENPLPGEPPTYPVKRFVEKPNLEKALQFLNSGRYYWNSGIFAWKAGLILEKIQKYLPELYRGLKYLEPSLGGTGEEQALREVFPSLPSISIDYGVMEKEQNILVVEGSFQWDDLGSWAALAEHAFQDKDGNTVRGRHVCIDTKNCLVYGQDNLIATLGVEGLIIVESDGVVIVCPKDRAQEVKALVQKLNEKGLDEHL